MTSAFGTIVMAATALGFYALPSFISQDALADSIASLGLAVASYCGITAYSHVWYFWRSLSSSARNLLMRGIFPLRGALAMTWAFVQRRGGHDQTDHAYTAYGPIGGVFVGVGMLALGFRRCCCAPRSAPSGSSAAKPSRRKPKSRAPHRLSTKVQGLHRI
jgi:hypothetical protein